MTHCLVIPGLSIGWLTKKSIISLAKQTVGTDIMVLVDSIIADCTIIHEWYVNGTKPRYLDHDDTYDGLQEHLPNVYGAREHYFHYYTHHEDYRWNGIFDRLVIVTDPRKYSRKRRFYKYMVVRSVEGLIPLMKQTECMKEFNDFYKEKFGVDVNGE